MNRFHNRNIALFPVVKKPINIEFSDSYSDYSGSDNKETVQPKNTLRCLKVSEERPRSHREEPHKNILLFDSELDISSTSKQKSSFLSDDENLCESVNHISSFSTPKKNIKTETPLSQNEKPDWAKRKKELQPQIQQQEQTEQGQQTQDQQDVIRRKKRKKVRSKQSNQTDSNDKSSNNEGSQNRPQQNPQTLSRTQPPTIISKSQPLQQRHIPLKPQPPSQQTQSSQQNQQPPPQQLNAQFQRNFSHTQPPSNKLQNNQNQPQQLPQKQIHMQRTLQQRTIQQNQKSNEQETTKNKDQQQTDSIPDSPSLLTNPTPPRRRYNSSSETVMAKKLGAIETDDLSQNKPISRNAIIAITNNTTNNTNMKPFFKPNYDFMRTSKAENTTSNNPNNSNLNTSEIESQEDDVTVPRKRKKVSRKSVKLSISDSNYTTFYYSTNSEPIKPPPGDLFAFTNGTPLRPFTTPTAQAVSPVTRNSNHPGIPPIPKKHNYQRLTAIPLFNIEVKESPKTSRPIPSPKILNGKEAVRSSKSGTEEDESGRSEYESEPSELQLSRSSTSGSSNINSKLNKSFMSQAVFNDLNEQYKPSNEETMQAFEPTIEMETSTLTFHRVPTLAAFEQSQRGTTTNQSEMINNPQIAFSKIFLNLNNSGDEEPADQTETEVDFGSEEEESLADTNNIVLDANIPIQMNAAVIKKKRTRPPNRPKSRNISLKDMKFDTKPEFKTLEDTYKKLVNEKNQNVGNSVNLRESFVEYNLTLTVQPDENDITIYEQEGLYCVERITPEAFIDFKFGPQITEPNPDHLHIFTWHNLGIRDDDILKSLLKIVSKIENNEDDSTEKVIQMKSVIQYIFTWIYLFAIDFYGNIETTSLLRKLLNIILDKSKPFKSHFSFIANYICFLKACLDSLSQKKSTPESYSIPIMKPKKTVFFNGFNNIRNFRLKELKLEPSVLVQHFTYVELELFRKIDRSEIIKQVSFKFESKEQKEKLMPNYTNYYVRFNNTAVFIASSILVDGGSKVRAKKIEYWIKVMDEAKKFRNYFLLYEIDAALSCFPINRLEKTWKRISKKSITVFNGLHSITNPTSKAIIAYKKEVNRMPSMTMPYIGPFLTELRYIFEGKKLMLPMEGAPNREGYNMKYHKAFCNVLEQIFQEWGTKIDFQIDNSLLEQCVNLENKEMKTEDLMKDSCRFEPPNS